MEFGILFTSHPNHATARYTSIGGSSTLFVIDHFQARKVRAESVRA